MSRKLLIAAGVLGLLGVLAGTFGAHVFKSRVTLEQLVIYEVGVRYHMYHALALLGVAILGERRTSGVLRAAGWLMVIGIVIFSGSLYVMTVGEMYQMGQWKWLGAITPIGGLCLMAGWVCVIIAAVRRGE